MKIAVIRQECSFRKGGAERYAANLCRELAEMGHEVWVIAETFDPEIHPTDPMDGCPGSARGFVALPPGPRWGSLDR